MDERVAKRRHGCLSMLILMLVLPLRFCGYARWSEPRNVLPTEVEWSEVLAFGSTFGLREGCSFGVYRLSDRARNQLLFKAKLPAQWHPTPIKIRDGQYARVGQSDEITLYALHATTCASETADRYRLVEAYQQALNEQGNWIKVLNHGEAMIVIAPRRGLVWFLGFG